MTIQDLSKTALLLVDVQQGFSHTTHWGRKRSNPAFEDNLTSLLAAFRNASTGQESDTKALIVHVYHVSKDPESILRSNSPNVDFHTYDRPIEDEPVISKSVNSSFIGTNLEIILRERGIERLFIAGLTTDHCVSTTTRMAANLGVTDVVNTETGNLVKGQVVLVEDACATWERGSFEADTVHKVQIESLRGEFCDIMTTAQVKVLLMKAGT